MTWPSSNLYRHLDRVGARRGAAVQRDAAGSRALCSSGSRSAQVVLLGEASHGTQDFYHLRASITKHLIRASRADRRRRRSGLAGRVSRQSLRARRGRRWRRQHRARRASSGFRRGCGATPRCCRSCAGCASGTTTHPTQQGRLLRPRSLQPDDVDPGGIAYLDKVDPAAAARARATAMRASITSPATRSLRLCGVGRHHRAVRRRRSSQQLARAAGARGRLREPRWPGRATTSSSSPSRTRGSRRTPRSTTARCSAAVTRPGTSATRHMADTFDALVRPPGRRNGVKPRIAVWAHNSHLGDARATEMGERGELNLGQLLRERYGADAQSIGFTTYDGTVTAASDWDARRRAQGGAAGARRVDRSSAARRRHCRNSCCTCTTSGWPDSRRRCSSARSA